MELLATGRSRILGKAGDPVRDPASIRLARYGLEFLDRGRLD
jgi:hypothetical protein